VPYVAGAVGTAVLLPQFLDLQDGAALEEVGGDRGEDVAGVVVDGVDGQQHAGGDVDDTRSHVLGDVLAECLHGVVDDVREVHL
jgi:hypothetical protein